MARFPFDNTSKMSDLLIDFPQLTYLLPRFGLSLGFGDCSVHEVCSRHNVPDDFFLLICAIHATGELPRDIAVESVSPECLVPFLRGSHQYYVDKRLPHIEEHLHHIADLLPVQLHDAFMAFFEDYKRDVDAHFAHEEQRVFPHITALERGERPSDYSIDLFTHNHGNLEDKLNDLMLIIFKYLPEDIPADGDSVEVVGDILQLTGDLHCHSIVEERVMVPYVKRLEANANNS